MLFNETAPAYNLANLVKLQTFILSFKNVVSPTIIKCIALPTDRQTSKCIEYICMLNAHR